MTHQHVDSSTLLNKATALCDEKGLSLTPTRKRVLELLLNANGPVKAYDLLSILKPGTVAKPPTIYRALEFLTDAGLVHKIESLNAYMACAHNQDDFNFELFICEACGSVDERHSCETGIVGPDGFSIIRSVIEHYGVCASCAS